MNFTSCLRDINRKSSADAQNERSDEANIDSSIEIIMFIIRIQSDLISVCFSFECIMHSLVVYAKKVHRNGNNNLSCVAKNSANNECFRCFSGSNYAIIVDTTSGWESRSGKWENGLCLPFFGQSAPYKTNANEL
jgi:hypothetical protein